MPDARLGSERARRRGDRGPESMLVELEARHAEVCRELAELETRLRELRTAAELCPLCGGAGVRWIRGGMYGEFQQRPCPCREG